MTELEEESLDQWLHKQISFKKCSVTVYRSYNRQEHLPLERHQLTLAVFLWEHYSIPDQN